MKTLQSLEPMEEFSYFSLPDTDLADVIICRNEKVTTIETEDGQNQKVYEYDYNTFRTTTEKEVIENNLDFYFTYIPENINYPQKIAQLEKDTQDLQLTICDIYELIAGGIE